MPKVATCLWFEKDTEAAAHFYCSLLPDSRVDHVFHSPIDYPAGKVGDPLLVLFTLGGHAMQGSTPAQQRPNSRVPRRFRSRPKTRPKPTGYGRR